LMVAAEADARQLLATLGYFTPTLTLELIDTPDAPSPHAVRLTAEPGTITSVRQVEIGFDGAIATDLRAEAQRNAVRAGWSLRPGQGFSQQGWDSAKSSGLRSIAAKRFPTASIQSSRADIDADTSSAQLQVRYDSGPAYRFGPLLLRGSERYDADAGR